MSELYQRIESLCRGKGVNITVMCRDCGVSRASLTDLKMGRKHGLSAETLSKIGAYFGVTVDYLLGAGAREISDEDIKFALFNGAEGITDEAYEEVKRFAAYVKEKYQTGKAGTKD
ncbi:MAG TPA: helix-turn-helix transcriptional regulator [Candidatus Gallacutalibacter stercoravium]|nr:helix-turn-helix transcriptional regulator [Candidatus Gallacutalibacter stercoravium]